MNWLLFARDFLLGHYRDQKRPEDHASESDSETEYDERQSMVPFTEPNLETLPRPPTPEERSSDAAQQRDLVNWTRRLFKATGALAAATFTVAAFSGWQAYEMQRGSVDTARLANAANRSADLSESAARAWIAPMRFALVNIADADDPLKVRITYQNVGREPAKAVKNWLGTGFIPPPLPPSDQWGEISGWYVTETVQSKNICRHVVDIHKTSVVYPSAISGFSVDTSKFKIDQNTSLPVDDIKQQKDIYFVVGCFSYETLGRTRYSSFCAYLNPFGGGKEINEWLFSACPVGNDDW